MKIWVKYVIGLTLGIIAGIVFSNSSAAALNILKPVTDIFINIGRYSFYPLVFFSLAVGVHELLLNKKFLAVHLKTAGLLIISAVFLTMTGVFITLVFSPERIPVIFEKKEAVQLAGFYDQLISIFPKNIFSIVSDNGSYILPAAFLAMLLGINFNFDKIITKPAVQFFDSFNRIFYHLNSLIIELMAPAMGFFSAFLVFSISSLSQISLDKQLCLFIFINTVIVIFLFLPAILYVIGFKENPYKYIYAVTGAAIAGFLTGDNYLGGNVLIKHAHENLGVPRQSGTVSQTLFILFGRAGTAMITSICFIIILKSYTSIEVNLIQILRIILFIFLISFTLASVPGQGVLISLVMICGMYGNGLEDGYLILTPVMPLLLSFSVFLDIIIAGISSMIVAWSENLQKEVDVRDYV